MKPFIIAEIGVNHDGVFDKAIKLIQGAVSAGADAVKFQSFAAERLASSSTPKVAYQIERDQDRSHFQMLKSLELSFSDQEHLFQYCKKYGIEFLSTPYSQEDASFLNSLGVEKFKVASADIVDLPLHELISSFRKLTLISTGMASQNEISEVVEIYKANATPFVLLHTTSEYPAKQSNANLAKLNYLKTLNPNGLGYSDHTPDSLCGVVATGLGCTYFEKHLTIDKSSPGPDHSASLSVEEFGFYVTQLQDASRALGSKDAPRTLNEEDMARTSRKSLHYSRNVKAGEILESSDLTLLRPGLGLPWTQRDQIIGHMLTRDVKKYEIVATSDFKS